MNDSERTHRTHNSVTRVLWVNDWLADERSGCWSRATNGWRIFNGMPSHPAERFLKIPTSILANTLTVSDDNFLWLPGEHFFQGVLGRFFTQYKTYPPIQWRFSIGADNASGLGNHLFNAAEIFWRKTFDKIRENQRT